MKFWIFLCGCQTKLAIFLRDCWTKFEIFVVVIRVNIRNLNFFPLSLNEISNFFTQFLYFDKICAFVRPMTKTLFLSVIFNEIRPIFPWHEDFANFFLATDRIGFFFDHFSKLIIFFLEFWSFVEIYVVFFFFATNWRNSFSFFCTII